MNRAERGGPEKAATGETPPRKPWERPAGQRRTWSRWWLAIPAGLALVILLPIVFSSFSTVATGPDQVALQLTGTNFGFSDKRVQEACIPPSTAGFKSEGDEFVYFPTSQRVYEFSNGETRDGEPIRVSAQGAELTVTGDVKFRLNTDDCEVLRGLYLAVMRRYDAVWEPRDNTDPPGWRNVLSIYVRTPLERALDEATAGYTALELYNDVPVDLPDGQRTTARAQWEAEVERLTAAYVAEAFGITSVDAADSPLLDFSATVQKPSLPAGLQEELNKAEEIAQAQRNQDAQNTVISSQSDGIQDLIDQLGVAGYLEYQRQELLREAIANGNVSILPVPEGTELRLDAPSPASSP